MLPPGDSAAETELGIDPLCSWAEMMNSTSDSSSQAAIAATR